MSASGKQLFLVERVAAFQKIIAGCEVTRREGSILDLERGMGLLLEKIEQARERSACVYVVGNGGSASVASHMVVDLLNVAKVRAFALHDASVMTCMANDYGYDNAFANILSTAAVEGDLLIAISSSGRSQNIRNAVTRMRQLGGESITLSSFASDNPLRSLGDLNVWLDSDDYGYVEVGHQFVLHNVIDRFAANQRECSFDD